MSGSFKEWKYVPLLMHFATLARSHLFILYCLPPGGCIVEPEEIGIISVSVA